MKTFLIVFGLAMAIILVGFLGGILNFTCGVAGRMKADAANTIAAEFSPSELLRKYEWFKDASAQCDKKLADIRIYEGRIKTFDAQGIKDRVLLEQYMIWTQELVGVKASYNGLAAEYNAQMAKINWRFTNAGGLPEGAMIPLPREFKPYTE